MNKGTCHFSKEPHNTMKHRIKHYIKGVAVGLQEYGLDNMNDGTLDLAFIRQNIKILRSKVCVINRPMHFKGRKPLNTYNS